MRNRTRFLIGAAVASAAAVVTAQPPARPAATAAPRPPTAKAPMAAPMAEVDPALFKGLKYRLVGPSRGGRVTTVTGVPSQPKTFYMGVASGGVFRTTDGGGSWAPITDGKVPLGSTGSIAVADSDPKIIYLGTGSDGVRSNVSTGRGVYRTADGGETWQFAGLRDAGQIGAVRIHPTNPDVVWVAANGDAFRPRDTFDFATSVEELRANGRICPQRADRQPCRTGEPGKRHEEDELLPDRRPPVVNRFRLDVCAGERLMKASDPGREPR